jgi:hypothetical protein
MTFSRIALFGACLALPAAIAGGAMAQPADASRVIQVPPGTVVLILGAPNVMAAGAPVVSAPAPEAMPMLQLIAQQQAMMQRMVADMDSLFPPMPDPAQMIRAAMEAAGQAGAAGTPGVTMTSVGGGHGVCGESVSYVFNGNGAQPIVHVTRYGDACGAAAPGGAQNVTEPQQPVPTHANQPKVLDIGYPAQPVTDGVPPRT